MQRREFVTLLGSAAVVWPVLARAQQADKTPRVAFLGTDRTSPPQIGYYQAFSAQLEKNGFREGQNMSLNIAPPTIRAAHLLVRLNCCVVSRI
jgi:putative ABC transport system substrate-binding protein